MNDAKRHQRSLVISLLDLKNAFGEVQHNLIRAAIRDVRPRGLASASRSKNLASASASASWVVASASASASWVFASASWVLASSLEASRGLQPKRKGMWLEVNQ